jgi:hypothetical protein
MEHLVILQAGVHTLASTWCHRAFLISGHIFLEIIDDLVTSLLLLLRTHLRLLWRWQQVFYFLLIQTFLRLIKFLNVKLSFSVLLRKGVSPFRMDHRVGNLGLHTIKVDIYKVLPIFILHVLDAVLYFVISLLWLLLQVLNHRCFMLHFLFVDVENWLGLLSRRVKSLMKLIICFFGDI